MKEYETITIHSRNFEERDLMKKILSLLLALAIVPAFAVAEDGSVAKAAVKLNAATNPDDSLAKKAVKVKAADNIMDNSDNSTVEKAVKLEVMKEVTD